MKRIMAIALSFIFIWALALNAQEEGSQSETAQDNYGAERSLEKGDKAAEEQEQYGRDRAEEVKDGKQGERKSNEAHKMRDRLKPDRGADRPDQSRPNRGR